jgi:THO complex subunit 3
LVCGDKDDLITFYDTRNTTQPIKEIQQEVEINEFSFNYSTDLFFMTTSLGYLSIFDVSLSHLYDLPAHTSSCQTIDFDPKGRYFATGGSDAITAIWDCETLLCNQTISRLE